MKASSLSLLFTVLLFSVAVPTLAQEATRKDFEEYCQLNEGRWIGDVTWVADWPGFGKKGDKVTAYFGAVIAEDGNAMTMRFLGGEGSATGVCYFDSGAKKIKFVWVHSSGSVTHNTAFKKDGRWIEASTGCLADGTKTTFASTLTMSDDGNTMTATGGGTVGDKKTDQQHDVWRRVSKGHHTASAGRPPLSAEIPKKAREALSFFVGNWESENYENDTKVGVSVDRRSWTPGKYCLTIDWSGTEQGVPWQASGITGWDAKANAVIEYWHGSQGQSLTITYPLDTMTPEAWEGTSCFTTADGTSSEGPCRLIKTPAGFEYVASSKHEGKQTVFRSVTRKINGKNAAVERSKAANAKPENIPDKAMAALKYFVGIWEGEDNSDGQDLGTNRVRRYWPSGKYCLRIEWSGEHDGTPGGDAARFSGLSGWDPKTKAVVDHWFGNRGQTLTNSYPIDKMKETVWEGTFAFTTANGESSEGKCRFTADPKEGVWIGKSSQGGEELVFKSVTRKVKK